MDIRRLKENKKLRRIAGIVAIVLLGAYLYTMFLPGLWYENAFLYQKKDGSFVGSDADGDYRMRMTPVEDGTEITFAVNETEKQYRIVYMKDVDSKTSADMEFYENGELAFTGTAVPYGDDNYWLMDENGEFPGVEISFGGNTEIVEPDPFPQKETLYGWAVREKYDTRGEPYFLIVIAVMVILLTVDIKDPDFFFRIRHGFYVDGGEPSDWYRTEQMIVRVFLAFGIGLCMLLSLTTH